MSPAVATDSFHGGTGLALAWGLVAAPMALLNLKARVSMSQWIRFPVQVSIALVVALVAGWVIVTPAVVAMLGRPAVTGIVRAVTSVSTLLLVGYLFWRYMHRGESHGAVLLRGTQLVDEASVGRVAWWQRAPLPQPGVTLAGLPVSEFDEVKHFKILGTTGAGKSTAIRELLDGALARGDRAIIADPDGGYRARYFDASRGDVVLNPFDPQSVRWNPFLELRSPYDVDQLASSLIPDGDEWSLYARTFLAAVIGGCHSRGVTDVGELWRLVAVATPQQLREVVTGTAAQPFLEEENARMFGSVRSVAVSALASVRYLQSEDARFSVRDWVRSGRGVLFLPYSADQIASLRGLIATWLRMGIFETMVLGEIEHPADRRLWFVMDELDSLGRVDGLKDALARLRKFGGRCVLGFQSVAQVRTTYGDGEAHTIVENASNTLILRCGTSEGGGTAEFASSLIGQREVIRTPMSVSHSRGAMFFGRGESQTSTGFSEQQTMEAAVLASEIEALRDLEGFAKISSRPEWVLCVLGHPNA